MPHADGGEHSRNLAALGRGRDGEALSQPAAPRVDAELAPGLGVDEIEEPDVRQLLLAGISDLDGDHVMVPGELEQRSAPFLGAAKVGHDDHERALARERSRSGERPREGARARALRAAARRGSR